MMRSRQLLALVLSEMLLGPGSFAGPPPAGQVAGVAGPSKAATVNGVELTQGSNILSGQIVEVSQDGETVILFGHNSLARISGDSAVRLFRCGGNTTLQLLHGQMAVRSAPQQPVEVEIGDATIRSATGQEATGVLSLKAPNTLNITAQKGIFSVATAHDQKSLLLHEGETTQATLSTPATATPNPPLCGVAAAVPSQPSTTLWVTLGLVGAAAGAGAGLAVSAPTLTCQQRAALVSPYAFPCP